MKKYAYYIFWGLVVAILIFYSLNYQGGSDAMLAQVESDVTAISYKKAVLVKHIYVTPGQVVDSGDLLIEVERPGFELDLEKKLTEQNRIEKQIAEVRELNQNRLDILKAEKTLKQSLLQNEKEELVYELNQVVNRKRMLDSISKVAFVSGDSILQKKIELINNQLKTLEEEYQIEKKQLNSAWKNNTFHLNSELVIIEKEILDLRTENELLLKKANKKGTIGNLYVQLNELVPPFKTLLSVYDLNPTLIKAFVHEKGVKDLEIGAKVMVESINRKYSIQGHIMEIGSRVTSYPEKINPLMNQKSYGQEIFINIPNDNDFLNGEKVYVYIIEDES